MLSLRRKKDYLHLIDMAKNKTVLQTLGFAYGESEITFASQCAFTTLPLGEEAVESIGGSHRLSQASNRSVEIFSLLS